jgi:hypothetical protein
LSKYLGLAASVLATVTFTGVMFILSMAVGKTLGSGWQIALIPLDLTGGLALGTLIGCQAVGLRYGGET